MEKEIRWQFSITPAARGSSRELKALQELAEILVELEKTEAHLEKLQKNYNKAKAKL